MHLFEDNTRIRMKDFENLKGTILSRICNTDEEALKLWDDADLQSPLEGEYKYWYKVLWDDGSVSNEPACRLEIMTV